MVVRGWWVRGFPVGLGYANFYHAYIIVTENNGSNPRIYHGWNGGKGRFGLKMTYKNGSVGIQGRIKTKYGSYGPKWPEYEEPYKGPPEMVVVDCDKRPASHYNKKFERIADSLEADEVIYDVFEMNSNTVIREMLGRAGLKSGMPEFAVPAWGSEWPSE